MKHKIIDIAKMVGCVFSVVFICAYIILQLFLQSFPYDEVQHRLALENKERAEIRAERYKNRE